MTKAPHFPLQRLDAIAQLFHSGFRALGLCRQHPVLFGQLDDFGGDHIPGHTGCPCHEGEQRGE